MSLCSGSQIDIHQSAASSHTILSLQLIHTSFAVSSLFYTFLLFYRLSHISNNRPPIERPQLPATAVVDARIIGRNAAEHIFSPSSTLSPLLTHFSLLSPTHVSTAVRRIYRYSVVIFRPRLV